MTGINQKRVERISENGEVKTYDSVKEAAEDNNLYSNQIARSVKEDKPVKGYRYRYVEVVEEVRGKTLKLEQQEKPLATAVRAFRRKPFYGR